MGMDWTEFKHGKYQTYVQEYGKGLVDEKIIPLLNVLNSKPYYVTTSSCSGRIILLEYTKGKSDSSFYKKWHREITDDDLINSIHDYNGSKTLWFSMDSFILHLYAEDLASAQNFLKVTRELGIKRGGINHIKTYPFIEIMGNEKLFFPVYDKHILVNDDYLKKTVNLSNTLLDKVYSRLDIMVNEYNKL